MHGDALDLPFDDAAFERVVTMHFYGHLQPPERERFLQEARRVASELGGGRTVFAGRWFVAVASGLTSAAR